MGTLAVIFLCLCFVLPFLAIELSYRQTSYYKAKRRGFFTSLIFDKGALGEYYIYDYLKQYEQKGARFLFNVYLPSHSKNSDTTEIDVIMIFDKGICVFESKNYSGWIFGNENQKMWTQCLPQGKGKKAKKEKFYNPVWQNNAHIKALEALLSNKGLPVFSIITFSKRCTLKDISYNNKPTLYITKRNSIKKIINDIYSSYPAVLDTGAINELYNVLLPFTQINDEIKSKHIEQINNIKNR